jgi:formamidopyrimidine-DNA glycosylase
MPELPEVETTRQGILPHLLKQTVTRVIVRQPSLRWPIPKQLSKMLKGKMLQDIQRRGKYLLLYFSQGCLILHLGMSGKLRVLSKAIAPGKHDHCDIIFANDIVLRFNDPRRFGAVLWTENDPLQHPLLLNLGVEPLLEDFTPAYLYRMTRGKKVAIKQLIMDAKIIVGVGNIYANEALFLSRILPERQASSLTQKEAGVLVANIKKVLRQAIKVGGTTLKDFLSVDGKPGYFAQQLKVYGREGLPCYICQHRIAQTRQGQRSTYFCIKCQR